MARPYIPDPNTISPSGPFTPFPKLDRENDHAPVTETFTVPGIANLYALRLDFAILAQATLTIKDTATNAEFGIVQWETTPGPGQVAVFKDRGLLRFNSGAQGKNVSATYQPIGTVIDAQYEMTLQKYIEGAVATALNAALKNAANEFTAKQTISSGDDAPTLLELIAKSFPKIKFKDTDFENEATVGFDGDSGIFNFDVAIAASYLYGVLVGDGSSVHSINAANISSGTLALARLHSNVARRDQANTFTQNQTFNGIQHKFGNLGSWASPYNLLDTDYSFLVSIVGGGLIVNLPSGAGRVGKQYYFALQDGHATNTLSFKAQTSQWVRYPGASSPLNQWNSVVGNTPGRVYIAMCIATDAWIISSFNPTTT